MEIGGEALAIRSERDRRARDCRFSVLFIDLEECCCGIAFPRFAIAERASLSTKSLIHALRLNAANEFSSRTC